MTALPQDTPPVRLKFINYDARRQPKTSRWCIGCQRDLKPNETPRLVYVTADYQAVHPDDLNDRGPQPSDFGWKLIGLSCARRLGLEWTIKEHTRSEPPKENAACAAGAARVRRASAPGQAALAPPSARRPVTQE